MFDGFKIENLCVNQHELKQHKFIDLFCQLNDITGEIKTQHLYTGGKPFHYQAKYKGLTFTFFLDGTTQLNGSFHTYFNKGVHNHDDFHLLTFENVLFELKHTFKIDLTNSRLNNIEFGVNIELPYNPNVFIDSLIMHKRKRFSILEDENKYFAECSHTQFYIKVYNKGLQYHLTQNKLRFEVKYSTMESINNLGVKTLADLLNPNHIAQLKKKLIETFESVLIGDSRLINYDLIHSVDEVAKNNPEKLNETIERIIDKRSINNVYNNLSLKNQRLFIGGHSFNYWNNLNPKNSKSIFYKRDRSRFDRELKKYNDLLEITGATQLKKEVGELLVQKIDHLCNREKTGQIDHIKQQLEPQEFENTTEQKTGQIDPFYYSPSLPQPNGTKKQNCLVTGIDISRQKKGSKFISQKTVFVLSLTNPELYKELFEIYGSKRRNISKLKQSYHIAHNIRNHYFRNNQTAPENK
jgi:hypothetical protein